MKRMFFSVILILSLLFSLSGSIFPVQAGYLSLSPDGDRDGLSNAMEVNGWYNLAGGPYFTNPNMADTDQDGLTDAQEKLFNTNPNDPKSPGISVEYENTFQTLKYYSTKDPAYLALVQGGDRYLLTEGLVVRRGTSFKINAINTSTATLTISGDGLTPIIPVRDPARGGWLATIPADGTVGTYTATITNGAWSKSMPIYVIFELPTDLTQAQINAYLYDNDPADKRDEVAVWWRAMDWKYYNSDSETPTPCLDSDPICSNWQYHTMSGFAQAFWTEQFTKNVLVNFTMPVIQGKTNTYDAALAIGDRADQAVWVNFSGVKNSFSSATKYFYTEDPSHPGKPYHMDGGACETQAGVFTAMLRSVGIASRPFALDYNKTEGHGENGNFGVYEYDHAVMLWVNGVWYAERTFTGSEPEYSSTPSWTNGSLAGLHLLKDWAGMYKYQDLYADAIQSANENWDFQNGSLGGGTVNTAWTGTDVPGAEFTYINRDFKWNSKTPLDIQQSPNVDILNCQLWKGDGWAPSEWLSPPVSNPAGRDATHTYTLPNYILPDPTNPIENWPYNPKPTSCSDSTSQAACDAFMLTWQATCAALPGQTWNAAQTPTIQPAQSSNAVALNTTMQIGSIIGDSGLDQNGDGRYEQLNVQFNLTSSVAGKYQVGGWLKAGEKEIRAEMGQVNLVPGKQNVQVSFDGQAIGDNQADGPYQVEALWIAPADQAVSEMALPEEMTAYQTYSYKSQAYQASNFTVQSTSFAGNYSYQGIDRDANGLFKAIIVSVPLKIALPGTYNVTGDLYDGQGGFVGHAEWTGSSPDATLEFQIAKTSPPYSLEHLNLIDLKGKGLEALYAPVYKIEDLSGKVSLGSISLANYATVVSPQSITPQNTFTVTPVDSNGNGRFDQLNVSAAVDVTDQGGSYWIEGMLVDERDMPVAWSVGNPQTLAVGTNQNLQMTFDGRQLFDQLPLAAGQKFTLTAVKIFSGSPAHPVLEADVPVTNFSTPTYTRSMFDPSEIAAPFEDDLENGESKWVKNGSWSLESTVWNSGSHAYEATGSGILTMAAPIDFTQFRALSLQFSYACDLGDNTVNLEISTNGTDWTALKTYSGMTSYWTNEVVDLNSYKGANSVWIRFNSATTSGEPLWYLDDISLVVEPYSTFVPAISH